MASYVIFPNNKFSSITKYSHMNMKKLELVFIPVTAPGHLTSSIEFAKRLIDQDQRLSITFLIIPLSIQPFNLNPYSNYTRIRFIIIPPISTFANPLSHSDISLEKLANIFFENHKSHVEKAVIELLSNDDNNNSTKLIGFILDMFSSCMIDIANKFDVPSYIFLTSNTAFLGLLFHLPIRHNEIGLTFHPTDPDSIISSYRNPVPTNVLPDPVFDEIGGGYEAFLYHGKKFKEAKGIIVNSFVELEPYAVRSMLSNPPTVYPVGPLLNYQTKIETKSTDQIKNWLDNQPQNSVVFLCFGSNGCFDGPQVQQIATALERTNHRFLWSLGPDEAEAPCEGLPDGFLSSVKERGLLCGWAPQVQVLTHTTVKGFVSHCGWNSILESLMYGVPIATWPLRAEQQLNGFLMVKELGLAMELSLSYRRNGKELLMADEIEKGINLLMDDEKNKVVREKVKEMSEKSKKALMKDGSSYITLGNLVKDMLKNISLED